MVGIGRPLIADPGTVVKLLSGEIDRAPTPEDRLDLFHILGWNNAQLERLADGLDPDLELGGAEATAQFRVLEEGVLQAMLNREAKGLPVAGSSAEPQQDPSPNLSPRVGRGTSHAFSRAPAPAL